MFKFKPAFAPPSDGGAGTPGGTPPAGTPPIPAPPPPAGTPPAGTPPIPAPPPPAGTPPAFTVAPAPWKEGEVWQIDGRPWWETIAEEPVRELMKTKQYATPAIAAMAYHNLNKLQNGNSDVLAFPGENATPEQKAAFEQQLRAKRGVPEAADKYTLDFGQNPNDNMKAFATATAHKYGLTNAQAQELVNDYNKLVGELNGSTLQQQQAQNEKDMTALETRWGTDFEKHRAAGEKAMRALGLDQATMDRIDGAMGTAATVELLAILGSKIGENASWVNNGGAPVNPNDPASMTPQAAQARIQALQTDAPFQEALNSRTHPNHAAVLAQWEALHAKASSKPTA